MGFKHSIQMVVYFEPRIQDDSSRHDRAVSRVEFFLSRCCVLGKPFAHKVLSKIPLLRGNEYPSLYLTNSLSIAPLFVVLCHSHPQCSPATQTISSDLLPSLGQHFVKTLVHRPSSVLTKCPGQAYFSPVIRLSSSNPWIMKTNSIVSRCV